jgi:hypothetical protein
MHSRTEGQDSSRGNLLQIDGMFWDHWVKETSLQKCRLPGNLEDGHVI